MAGFCERGNEHVGFDVLTTVSPNSAVFWVLAPCTFVEVYQRFRDSRCLHRQGDESSVSIKEEEYLNLMSVQSGSQGPCSVELVSHLIVK